MRKTPLYKEKLTYKVIKMFSEFVIQKDWLLGGSLYREGRKWKSERDRTVAFVLEKSC
jgi:hypothetical protein